MPSVLELVSDRIRNQIQAAWNQAHFLNHLLKHYHLLSAHCIPLHRSAAEYFGVFSKGDLLPAVINRKERRGREFNYLSRPHNYKWPRPAFLSGTTTCTFPTPCTDSRNFYGLFLLTTLQENDHFFHFSGSTSMRQSPHERNHLMFRQIPSGSPLQTKVLEKGEEECAYVPLSPFM